MLLRVFKDSTALARAAAEQGARSWRLFLDGGRRRQSSYAWKARFALRLRPRSCGQHPNTTVSLMKTPRRHWHRCVE